MGTGLVTIDHYTDVILINWTAMSAAASPGQAVAAGDSLKQEVVTQADQLAARHLGDVVDLHFIGHSRGAVVVDRAMQDLVGTTDPALQGSFIKATLLDPHPANGSTIFLASTDPVDFTPLILPLFVVYEGVATIDNDPQIVIPRNAKYIEIDFQQSSFTDCASLNRGLPTTLAALITAEFYLNLWGEGPSDGIINQSSAAIHWTNLSDMSIPGTRTKIGHSEVTNWYQTTVVNAGTAYFTGGGGGGGAAAPTPPPQPRYEIQLVGVALPSSGAIKELILPTAQVASPASGAEATTALSSSLGIDHHIGKATQPSDAVFLAPMGVEFSASVPLWTLGLDQSIMS